MGAGLFKVLTNAFYMATAEIIFGGGVFAAGGLHHPSLVFPIGCGRAECFKSRQLVTAEVKLVPGCLQFFAGGLHHSSAA